MRITHFLFFLFFFPFKGFSYQVSIDSLKKKYEVTTEKKLQVEILIKLTKAYRYVDIKSAVSTGYEAQKMAQSLNDSKLEIRAIQELVMSQISLGEFDNGLKLLDKSIQLSKKNNDEASEADALSLMGYIYRRKGKNDLSLKSYETCLALSEKVAYKDGIAKAEKGFGDLNERQGNYLKSLDNYSKALKIAQESKDLELEMNLLNATGIIYDYQGDGEKGLAYYLEALKIAESTGNLVKAADFSGNVASVQFYLENYEKSLEYYLKGIDLAQKTFNKSGVVSNYQGIVIVYNRLNEPEKALKFANLDLKMRKEMGDVRGMSYAYKNLGSIYQRKNDFEKAEENYLLGLKFAKETDQKIKIAVMNLELGRLYNSMKQSVKAIPFLEETAKITKDIGVLREQSLAYEDLATAYSNLGQMDKAYQNQKKFTKIKEELISQDRNEQTVKMQTVYETKNRDEKIANLEKESILKEEVITQSNLIKNLSFVGIALLLLVAGLFYNRSRLKQKSNALLTEKNEKIEKQNEVIQSSLTEKETLLREIHHRVKNNLQIISSLLNIQSRNIDDPNVLSSIKEGQSRVQAMSLIHQNLYQSEHINNVDIENYLKELVVYLSNMFRTEGKNIEVEVKAENIEFDIDTAIPLGLIVNELVSNAYKYAFDNKDTGTIKIGIKAINNIDYELNVEDDGDGLPKDFNQVESKSLGLKLVKILTKQLRGALSTNTDKGASFKVLFKDIRAFQTSQV